MSEIKNYFNAESALLRFADENEKAERGDNEPWGFCSKRYASLIAIDEVGRGCIAGPVLSCVSLWILKDVLSNSMPFKKKIWLPFIFDSKKISAQKRQACFNLIAQEFDFNKETVPYACVDALTPQALCSSFRFFHFDFEFDNLKNLKNSIGSNSSSKVQSLEAEFECIALSIGEASAREIDQFNIWNAVQLSIARGLKNLSRETKKYYPDLFPYLKSALFLMDGKHKIKVPKEFKDNLQVTCIKADEKFLSVGFSSIVAKVVRDAFMESQDQSFPAFLFSKHKGYGTKKHFDFIQQYGVCALHRRSFLTQVRVCP